ncbi:peptidoglycan-binding domain-containing protein [Luteibacter pinisoli]|nr:peptidoglycan-binding domain-containing protein [Luteibacter pinisoli]
MFFIVGRGTEGGAASYRLSVAGVTDKTWGDASHVADNSGYSIGTIQVDLGQRGTWPLGSIDGTPSSTQATYVDSIIDQSSAYSSAHGLPFPTDKAALRSDLLTHGNGERGRSTISFIDAGTRTFINDWAASETGKKWVHTNVDYPQVKNATETATRMVDSVGKNISDDHRLETIAILTKTANQYPTQLNQFKNVMANGGTFEDVMDTALDIKSRHRSYAGPEAADVAAQYKSAFANPEVATALERAQTKVASSNFDPSTQTSDPDIRAALAAIGQTGRAHNVQGTPSLRAGMSGDAIRGLQTHLNELGAADTHGRALTPDGHFGPATRNAVENFQRSHAMTVDGVAGPETQAAVLHEVERLRDASRMSLSDSRHPGVSLYEQALGGVRGIDQQRGRSTDQASCNLAGSLAVAACSHGMHRIDHVVMSDDGARAYAVQGDLNSPFKVHANVDVAQSVNTPLEQSGAAFVQAAQQQADRTAVQQQQTQAQTQEAPVHQPAMHR